jgi:hypothetical protein
MPNSEGDNRQVDGNISLFTPVIKQQQTIERFATTRIVDSSKQDSLLV